MVLLSGKNKHAHTKLLNQLILPYLSNQNNVFQENLLYKSYPDLLSKKIIEIFNNNPLETLSGNLHYNLKTTIKILPEYEVYNLLFGKPIEYDMVLLQKVKECVLNKIPFSKIKSLLNV
jgi:hypothetical protein